MKDTPTLALRQERERRGWSRQYVAEQVEVDVITVGRWERGERMPHPHHRQKLCMLFEMDAAELGLLAPSLQKSAAVKVSFDEPVQQLEPFAIPFEYSSHQSDQPAVVLDQSVDTSPATVIVEPAERRAETSIVVAKAPTRFLRERRALLLAGVGGIAALAVGGYLAVRGTMLSASSTTIPMPIGRRLHHLVDPNTDNFVNYMAWSPDRSMMGVATGSNLVSIWDIEKEALLFYYPTLNGWVNDIAWSKTNIIAAATADKENGSLQLWEYPGQEALFTVQRPYGLRSVAWSPNSNYLAVSGRSTTVEVWEPFRSRVVSRYEYPALKQMGIRRVKWSPSGRFLACVTDDGTAHVWEAMTGKAKTVYRGHSSRLIDLSWSPDEQYIVSCGTDQTCQIWETMSGRHEFTYRGHAGAVEAVAWSPQGNVIASGGDDFIVHVWKAPTGKLVASYEGHHSKIEAVRWSLDSTNLAIGLASEGVEIWQTPEDKIASK